MYSFLTLFRFTGLVGLGMLNDNPPIRIYNSRETWATATSLLLRLFTDSWLLRGSDFRLRLEGQNTEIPELNLPLCLRVNPSFPL